MPDLRLITWNSSGESGNRGQTLVNFTARQNRNVRANVPPVQVVAIQEAAVQQGTIGQALANSAPFSNEFVQPQGFCREHDATQTLRVTPSRSYRLSWMTNNALPGLNLAVPPGGAGPQLVNLSPNHDNGVDRYIQRLSRNMRVRHDLRVAAANIRWPVYLHLTYGAVNGLPRHVHLFTWHAPLLANWHGANAVHAPFPGGVAQALPEAFEFFQRSDFFTRIMQGLAAQDVVIIAGDLNVLPQGMQLPFMFPQFDGVSDELEHILAYSPSGNVRVGHEHALITPYPPHTILAAAVHW